MYTVYAISSISRSYIYVGMTNDLERRLLEHQAGKNQSTKAYAPFILIHIEIFGDRASARAREKYLKSGSGKEFLRKLRNW